MRIYVNGDQREVEPGTLALALTALGYGVGANYTRVSGAIGKAAIVIAVLVVLGLLSWYLRGRRRRGAAAD